MNMLQDPRRERAPAAPAGSWWRWRRCCCRDWCSPSASRTSPASPACAATSWSATAWSSGSTAPATRPARRRSRCRASSTCWRKFGVTMPPNVNPQLKNVAAVTVHADLPPFAKPGQTIDVTVASIGNATSLRGGSLLMTPLRGADGEVYAMAQGSVVVSGFGVSGKDGSRVSVNVPSGGRMPNGATVEREVRNNFGAATVRGAQSELRPISPPPRAWRRQSTAARRRHRARASTPSRCGRARRPTPRPAHQPSSRRCRNWRSSPARRRRASSSIRAPAPSSSARTCA